MDYPYRCLKNWQRIRGEYQLYWILVPGITFILTASDRATTFKHLDLNLWFVRSLPHVCHVGGWSSLYCHACLISTLCFHRFTYLLRLASRNKEWSNTNTEQIFHQFEKYYIHVPRAKENMVCKKLATLSYWLKWQDEDGLGVYFMIITDVLLSFVTVRPTYE